MMDTFMMVKVALAVVALVYFTTLLDKVNDIMATVQDIDNALTDIAAGVNGLEDAIADLKTQVANGGVASEADLQGLADKAAAIGADIKDTSDQGNGFNDPNFPRNTQGVIVE